VVLPDFAKATQALTSFAEGLGQSWNSLRSSWDGVFRFLEDALNGEVLGIKLPIIGDQLKDAAHFVRALRQEVGALLDTSLPGSRTAGLVQDIIFRALGPAGLNWLQDLD